MKADPNKEDLSNENSIDGTDLDLSSLVDQLSNYTTPENSNSIFKSELISDESNDIKRTKSPANEIPKEREDLQSIRTVVRSFNGSTDVGIPVPGFGGIRLGKKEACLSSYYVEGKAVDTKDGPVVYGCGYSIHYLFKKVSGGISINNIPAISASVQLEKNKTEVYYSLQSYGIIGQNLVKFFKPNVNKIFDVEGFGDVQSSIDGIQNVLGDPILSKTVRFNPVILNFAKAFDLEQI